VTDAAIAVVVEALAAVGAAEAAPNAVLAFAGLELPLDPALLVLAVADGETPAGMAQLAQSLPEVTEPGAA
jgi:hypothetical protein